MDIAQEMLTMFNDDPDLLKKVITGDESWMYVYDIEMEASWRAKAEKSTSSSSNVKVLLNVFFDCNGVVQHEFLPQGCTVNKEYYLKVMCRLRKPIIDFAP